MAYKDFKDLARRTAPDKALIEKAFNNTKNPKYDGHRRSLASRGYTFLIKRLLHLYVNLLKVVVLLLKEVGN